MSLQGANLAELCPDVLPNLRVPDMVTNDYLVSASYFSIFGYVCLLATSPLSCDVELLRVQIQLTAATLSGHAAAPSTPLDPQHSNFTHPPSVLHLPEGKESNFGAACSLGMNAVIEVG